MAMSPEERASIEAAGFIVTTVDEFLGLSPEESKKVDQLAMAEILTERKKAAVHHVARKPRASRRGVSAAA